MNKVFDLRANPEMVGKGDCYEANFKLMADLTEQGIKCELVHGILTAPDFYEHMKEGTMFMHAWVEAWHEDHGWVVVDSSLCVGTDTPFTMHDITLFYDKLQPKHTVKMNPHVAVMMVNKRGWYGDLDLHPAHRRLIK